MTQVSKYPLSKKIENRVFEIFLISLAKVRRKEEVNVFIDDLLSPTERLMLAKRLSIAFLLSKGFNQREISTILKVSLTTINRVSLKLQTGGQGFHNVIKAIRIDESLNDFWQKLEGLIEDIVPSKGKNWKNWRRDRWQEKISKQKAF